MKQELIECVIAYGMVFGVVYLIPTLHYLWQLMPAY